MTAIDGTPVKAGDNYWERLNSPLNEYVTVSVASAADRRRPRATSGCARSRRSTNLKYEEWVQKNREFVDKATNGQIAYVHIQSMNQPSLVRFQNEINQFWQKKGIIVDIRYNGGGNTDQELIDILERRPYEYWNSRYGAPSWGRRPRQAIAGPKVMLINWRSASDSEVTPMAFKQLGLGRLVGNPTSAAVIATGSYALINGGAIRTPGSLVVTYDPERPNNFGINLENYGVAPDVWVENTPGRRAEELRPRAAGRHRRSDENAQGRALAVPREGRSERRWKCFLVMRGKFGVKGAQSPGWKAREVQRERRWKYGVKKRGKYGVTGAGSSG